MSQHISLQLPEHMRCLNRILSKLAAFGEDICIETELHSVRYCELRRLVSRWVAFLQDSGVAPGDVVALQAEYSADSVAILLALMSMSATVALLPSNAPSHEYFLRNSFASSLLTIAPAGQVSLQSLGSHRPRHPLLDELQANCDSGLVIFTSGSEGHPKAAVHSVERFLQKFQREERRFRTLAYLKLDHIGGIDSLFRVLSSGGTLLIPDRRDISHMMEFIGRKKVELLPVSPVFLRLLARVSSVGRYDFGSLKVIAYGGDPMDEATLAKTCTIFPMAEVIQKYGATEFGSPRTVSRAPNSLWVKVADDRVRTKIEHGILWIQDESIIVGYLNATLNSKDSWYCTGDLVEVDGEWIKFIGRVSETINVGGEKVMPQEIEDVLTRSDLVAEAMVTGEKNALLGQIVSAMVVLARELSIDKREAARLLRAHCRQSLSSFKIPSRFVFLDALPVTDRNKRLRNWPSKPLL